ncbi:MAG: aspartate/glutamate racemase family protein [Bosea sp.]|uniref:aspartate/glutamate racemase family protein n=1 Tax=Bosea sp. (in: a-proteobacteria) TaxID=1871050 RepID=UPI001AD53D42|nr:amino acid racemase [Bosea sp. (in: a-proteobacteria)]MBN9453758.1 aspartate/glutamate racemase family protein [Bosea sp. (in: a-proteobacteria)]
MAEPSQARPAVVGILGGMGPEATVDLMRRVIAATPARDDVDHVHMLVDNNPGVPSRIAALIDGTGASPLPELVRMAKGLAANGATMLAMPCNTAHYYADGLVEAVPLPFLNMVALSVERIAALMPAGTRVGLLASTAVFKIGLYEQAFKRRGLSIGAPDRQDEVMALIRAVKTGDTGAAQRRVLAEIAEQLVQSGAGVILVACTELSIMADSIEARVPVLDALDVLAEEIVTRVKGVGTSHLRT